jgi:hypothetical protein
MRSTGGEYDGSLHLWGDGMMHRLPEGFRFPSVSVSQCWRIWWEGNKEEKMSPWRYFSPHDIPKVEKGRWSDIKCLMKEMVKVLVQGEVMKEEDLRKMEETEEIIENGKKAVALFEKKTKKTKIRIEEWSVTTALRELREARTEKSPEKKRKQRGGKKIVNRDRNKRRK